MRPWLNYAAAPRLCVCTSLALLLCLTGCGTKPIAPVNRPREASEQTASASRELRIAAAADLKFMLEELIGEFERRQAGAKVVPTFGSSGSLYAQLSNEAPFDLFLSADIEYPRKLIESGHAPAGSDFVYATGHLVLWAPTTSQLDLERDGIGTLQDSSIKKIAIANPKTAPYGRAAVAALKGLGVYDNVESRLVYGENIAQTAQMIESGAADTGLISLSLAVSRALRDSGKLWRIPDDAYPAIIQGGLVMKNAREPELALAFRDFLLSADGGEILERFGFTRPGE